MQATQFHPERPIFEWRPNIGINHAFDVIVANRYLADFFVNDARRNGHVFARGAGLEQYSMYGYTTVAEGDVMDGYQAYIFSFA